ncbi:Gfo/Idh/MocA family oxidoreductase [Streptomyces sp. TRM66268-LWL]|uniref:Gfo/Idh/MocA family oxidoreductase n=1 Tax=Streptomyces polyasparticus TaxID=2767826 RepID=A0ABR7STS1_9ACTN|nr:Gfo/Idh/MocA family oxidoreductase [Streptomyces polyasparticus]MBC9718002.1 Gfo/Idh/MocA family oxidoreductase [Streptomyces polyasparticus]
MPVSIAAIGFGRHFRRSLLPNLLGCERFTLSAIAEKDPETRAEAATRFPGLPVLSDAKEVLDSPVDAVLISTHPAGHVELTRAALQAGKHVFVEKPLGTDPAAVRELAALAREQHRTVAVGTMWRHAPAHRLVDQWLAEHHAAARLLDIAVSFPSVYARDGWDLSAEELAFYDMFIHPLDWARHLLGGVGDVDAVLLGGARDGEVTTCIRLLSPSGEAVATINATTGSHAYQVATWLHTTTGDLIEVDTKDRLRVTTSPTWSGTEGSLRDRATLGWEAGQLYRGWARKGYAEELTAFADRIEAPSPHTEPDVSELDGAADTLELIGRCLSQIQPGISAAAI